METIAKPGRMLFIAALTALFAVLPSRAEPVIAGDVNGDGQLDISDASYLNNFLFRGGPVPGVFDVNGDGRWDIRDSAYLNQYLFAGGPAPVSLPSQIVNSVGLGSILSFSDPGPILASPGTPLSIPVSVFLQAEGDVQAWSFGVRASGNGTITSATTAGTDAAAYFSQPFEHTQLVTEGAVTAVELSMMDGRPIASGDKLSVLMLILEGIAPAAGATEEWSLSFSDLLAGAGQDVNTIATVNGLSYVPSLESLRIEVTGASVPEPGTTGVLMALGLGALLAFRRAVKRSPVID
jgi:hypothetical protein